MSFILFWIEVILPLIRIENPSSEQPIPSTFLLDIWKYFQKNGAECVGKFWFILIYLGRKFSHSKYFRNILVPFHQLPRSVQNSFVDGFRFLNCIELLVFITHYYGYVYLPVKDNKLCNVSYMKRLTYLNLLQCCSALLTIYVLKTINSFVFLNPVLW